jgi:CHAT domain-containing protein/tetratricopeptide (TPR) repeat protein
MKPILKTLLCATIQLVVFFHSDANAQKEFIDSIHNMLVDLNEQIQYAPINQVLQKTIPFSSDTTMNDSLEVCLRRLFSTPYFFREGQLQPVPDYLRTKYVYFIFRIISFFSTQESDSRYAENMMWMAIAKIILKGRDRVTNLEGLKQGGAILLQLQADKFYLPVARIQMFLGYMYDFMEKKDSAYLFYKLSLLSNPNTTFDEKELYDTSLYFFADFCRRHDKPDSAFLLFQQLLKRSKETYGENDPEYTYYLIAVADMFTYMAKYTAALELNFKGLPIIQTICGVESNQYALCLADIGEEYYRMGEYSKALTYSKQALSIKQRIFGKEYFDNVVNLHDLSKLYRQMGLYNEAIPLINESLAISKKYFGEDMVYANDLQTLAEVYQDLGQYDKALPLYQKTLGIQGHNSKDNYYYPRTLHSIACLYTSLGQYDKAIGYFKEALELKEKIFGEMHPEYTQTLTRYAEACMFKGDYKKALSLQAQSITIDKKLFGDTHPNIASEYYILASIYFAKGELAMAKAASERSLQIQYKIFDSLHPSIADNDDMLGDINKAYHHSDKALDYYQQAYTIRASVLTTSHPDYIKSLCNLGLIQIQKQNITKGSQLLMQADSLALLHIEQSYSSLSEEEKLVYLHASEKQFQYLPSLLYLHKTNDPGIINRIYNNEIALKSMILFYQQQVYNGIRKSNDSAVLELYTNWQFNKALLGQQLLLPGTQRIHEFDSLREVTTQMEEKLSNVSGSFRNNFLHTDIIDIKNHLALKEAAVEFIKFRLYNNKWTDSVIYAALVLLPGEKNAQFIPLFEERQLQKIFRFINNSEAAVNYLYPQADKETTASKTLFDLIWKPLQSSLDTVKTIYYSPCGLLCRISFNALHHGKETYLNDKYILRQLLCTRNIFSAMNKDHFSTASVWGDIDYNYKTVDTTKKYKTGKAFVSTTYKIKAFNATSASFSWRPLTNTKNEIENVAAILEQRNISCNIKTKDKANEEQFKKMNGKSPELLHLATHAFFLSPDTGKLKNDLAAFDNSFSIQNNPMFRTGLALAGANNSGENIEMNMAEDNVLTAYEISQLDLSDTKLVTLSACETALGDIQDNEGVFGLQRAFKMAGVKRVLMSLWKVPDKETSELMELFYTNLMISNDATIALHVTQLTMKEKYAPYYWAGFILTE